MSGPPYTLTIEFDLWAWEQDRAYKIAARLTDELRSRQLWDGKESLGHAHARKWIVEERRDSN